jgi:hypothetical protein
VVLRPSIGAYHSASRNALIHEETSMSDTVSGGGDPIPATPEEVQEAAIYQQLPTAEPRMTHVAQTQEEEEAAATLPGGQSVSGAMSKSDAPSVGSASSNGPSVSSASSRSSTTSGGSSRS